MLMRHVVLYEPRVSLPGRVTVEAVVNHPRGRAVLYRRVVSYEDNEALLSAVQEGLTGRVLGGEWVFVEDEN